MRLKIAILHDSARLGGAERGLVQLARNLNPLKFEVVVVCPKEGPLVEKLEKDGVHVIPMALNYFSFATRSSYIKYLTSVAKLYRLIKKLQVDILHCNSCRAAHWGVPLSKLLGVRTICHIRDSQYTKMTKFLLRHAPSGVELVAVSAAIKNAVQSTGVPQSKIRVIYNGEDAQFYRPDTSSDVLELEFPAIKNRLRVGILGRIVEWKRHVDLIEAAGLLKAKLDFHILVVGELWDQESAALSTLLQNKIRSLQLSDRVTFTGYREDVRGIVAALDIVVVPSEGEPFGRVIVEAMAMGKPVVGTSSGGIPEIIRHGIDGLLVRVKDPEAIAKAIEALAQDKEYAKKLGQNARERVVTSFSLENHIREIENLYYQMSTT